MDVDEALTAADRWHSDPVVPVLAAEVRRLRIELDWSEGDTRTEQARRRCDRERYVAIERAARKLVQAIGPVVGDVVPELSALRRALEDAEVGNQAGDSDVSRGAPGDPRERGSLMD